MSFYACRRCGSVRVDDDECQVCGWDRFTAVDVASAEPAEPAEDEDVEPGLDALPHVGPATADQLRDAGYESVDDVASADVEQLAEDVDGLGTERASDTVDVARDLAG